jgi:allantoicase
MRREPALAVLLPDSVHVRRRPGLDGVALQPGLRGDAPAIVHDQAHFLGDFRHFGAFVVDLGRVIEEREQG